MKRNDCDTDPEANAGEPVNDGWVEADIEVLNPEDVAAALAVVDAPYRPGLDARFDSEEVTDDGLDLGAVSRHPQG